MVEQVGDRGIFSLSYEEIKETVTVVIHPTGNQVIAAIFYGIAVENLCERAVTIVVIKCVRSVLTGQKQVQIPVIVVVTPGAGVGTIGIAPHWNTSDFCEGAVPIVVV